MRRQAYVLPKCHPSELKGKSIFGNGYKRVDGGELVVDGGEQVRKRKVQALFDMKCVLHKVVRSFEEIEIV